MTKKIDKALIIGFGSMGKRYSKLLEKYFPEIELKILRHQYSKTHAKEFRYDFIYDIKDALLFNPNIAIVANPASHHLKISKLLAEKKIHLLIEKPISDSSKGLEEFLNFCENQGVIVMTGYNLRFSQSINEFRKLIYKEHMGKILKVHAEVGQYLPTWRDSNYIKSVSANKNLGGGVLLELSHEIDYLTWIFGPIKRIKSHLSKQSDLNIDVEDSANILFSCDTVMNYQVMGSLKMDFIRHDKTRFCEVICENGTLLWDGITGDIKCFPKNQKDWKVLFQSTSKTEDTYLMEIQHFFSSICENKLPIVSGRDGLNVVRTIEAIKDSNNSVVNL
jgi:predicted dehydrogenase